MGQTYGEIQVNGTAVNAGNPLPVTGATANGSDVATGATTDAAASSDNGTFSLISLFKRLLQKFTTGIALGAGEAHLGEVGGLFADNGQTTTRPNDTTAYASGDLVANSVTAGSVVPLAFTVTRIAAGSAMIRRVRFKKSGTTITNASFRVHFYKTSPTPSNGDNGVWLTTESTYLGSVDCDLTSAAAKVFTDAAKVIAVPTIGSEIIFSLSSGQLIYGLIEARAAYTPIANEVFTVVLELAQN